MARLRSTLRALSIKEITMSSVEPRGQFVWHELLTTDTAAAGAFYPRVAGWKSQPWEENSDYTLWIGKSGPMGGLMNLPAEAAAPPLRTHRPIGCLTSARQTLKAPLPQRASLARA
jgi:hypothetical protein